MYFVTHASLFRRAFLLSGRKLHPEVEEEGLEPFEHFKENRRVDICVRGRTGPVNRRFVLAEIVVANPGLRMSCYEVVDYSVHLGRSWPEPRFFDTSFRSRRRQFSDCMRM